MSLTFIAVLNCTYLAGHLLIWTKISMLVDIIKLARAFGQAISKPAINKMFIECEMGLTVFVDVKNTKKTTAPAGLLLIYRESLKNSWIKQYKVSNSIRKAKEQIVLSLVFASKYQSCSKVTFVDKNAPTTLKHRVPNVFMYWRRTDMQPKFQSLLELS